MAYSKAGTFLSQRIYVMDLLVEIGFSGGKGSKIPIKPNSKLWNNPNNQLVDKGGYQQLVRRLIYLSHTKLDITFAISLVSQFMHNPTKEHMLAIRKIPCYLKATLGKGILFNVRNKLNIKGFSYVDYVRSMTDRRSTSGYCVFL